MRLASVLLLFLPACFVEIHRGNGDPATETRDVGAFVGLDAGLSIPVDVTAGPTQSVEVRCDSNLLDDIDTTVVGGRLHIDTTHVRDTIVQIDPQTDCRVVVVAVGLESVAATGSGNVTLTGDGWTALSDVEAHGSGALDVSILQIADVTVFSTGSGSVRIATIEATTTALSASGSGGITVDAGMTDSLAVHVSGSGSIDAKGLIASSVDATLSGSGSAQVTADDALVAHLSGSGSLRVWGDPPQRDVTATGSGNVSYQ